MSARDQIGDADETGNGLGQAEPKLVEVTVDGVPESIPRGKYLVSDLKTTLGIPADYELDRVDGRSFKELPDGDTVEVHKGEVFVSHVRRGGSA